MPVSNKKRTNLLYAVRPDLLPGEWPVVVKNIGLHCTIGRLPTSEECKKSAYDGIITDSKSFISQYGYQVPADSPPFFLLTETLSVGDEIRLNGSGALEVIHVLSLTVSELFKRIRTRLDDYYGSFPFPLPPWPSWNEVRTRTNLERFVDLAGNGYVYTAKKVFLRELIENEGNLAALVPVLKKISRSTVNKLFIQHCNDLFAILVQVIPPQSGDKGSSDIPELPRAAFLKTMARKKIWHEFQQLLAIHQHDLDVVAKTLSVSLKDLSFLVHEWNDLMVMIAKA